MGKNRIFVASGDVGLREALARTLRANPDLLVLARGAAPASLRELPTFHPHLVVLDLGDFDLTNGLACVHEIHRINGQAATLVIVPEASLACAEPILEHVDGVLLHDELESEGLFVRLNLVLERVRRSQGNQLRYGDFVLLAADRTVRIGRRSVRLTEARFDLLRRLIANRGRTVSYRDLLECDEDVPIKRVCGVIKARAYHLRQSLGAAGRHIQCISGVGYRFDLEASE